MQKNVVRIIGGIFKRTKVDVLDIQGLRPTPDRLRETIFNWLGDINGYDCLDSFAGSGVIGFECISRGANATFIERNKNAYHNIQLVAQKLNINPKILNTDALIAINTLDLFDIIFIDPPYSYNLIEKFLPLAVKKLKPNGKIYIEDNKNIENILEQNSLSIIKFSKIGQIYAYVVKKI